MTNISTDSKKPLYLHEFPDFDDELRMIDGFVDDSYHNDAMPHIARFFYNEGKDYPVRIVEVYQDYKDRDRSEFGQYEPSKPYKRFFVDVMFADGMTEDLLLTASWEEAKKCALKAVAEAKAIGFSDKRPTSSKATIS